MRGVSHASRGYNLLRAKKVVQKNLARYTDNCGSQVRSGRRQSMPSSSIDNCARVSATVPLVACGHTKRPRSKRLANRQTVAVIPENFDQIAAPPAKHKHARRTAS